MRSSVLVKLIEDEYDSLVTKIPESQLNRNWHDEVFTSIGPEECVVKFKDWLKYVLKSASLSAGEYKIEPEDVLLHAASSNSSEQPQRPLHPSILKALSLYSTKELEELLGFSRTAKLLKLFSGYRQADGSFL